MKQRAITYLAGPLLLLLTMFSPGCSLHLRVPPGSVQIKPAVEASEQVMPTAIIKPQSQPDAATFTPTPVLLELTPEIQQKTLTSGEPAGCISADEALRALSVEERLARASQLLGFSQSLSTRVLENIWNPYTGQYYSYAGDVLGVKVSDVQNKHFIQKMMNALQVSGFITWLRGENAKQGQMHILAIPLGQYDWLNSDWAPYVQAYWQGDHSLPSGDPSVIEVLKTPPCKWMVEQGLAPQAAGKYLDGPSFVSTSMPDYAYAAVAYLADSSRTASAVASRIGWLGEEGLEGPNTMCGPLVWAILNDAGAFPPGWGAWSEGPIAFWLAMPRKNGRPWSLFPSETYHLYQFKTPLSKFDFSQFPLYPGDFLYTYSERVGFDHMLVITEVDDKGNVYTVTNVVQVSPEKSTTIERVLVLNVNDPTAGIARNQWAKDGINGRTGHDGFDVFRWVWADKDLHGEAARYTVQVGDTMQRVSMFWKTPAEQIARYNGIEEDALFVGQELYIPPNQTMGEP